MRSQSSCQDVMTYSASSNSVARRDLAHAIYNLDDCLTSSVQPQTTDELIRKSEKPSKYSAEERGGDVWLDRLCSSEFQQGTLLTAGGGSICCCSSAATSNTDEFPWHQQQQQQQRGSTSSSGTGGGSYRSRPTLWHSKPHWPTRFRRFFSTTHI